MMRVPGPELSRIASTARKRGVFVSLGFNEGTTASVGCIWNANVTVPVSAMTAPPTWPKPGKGHNDPSATVNWIETTWPKAGS